MYKNFIPLIILLFYQVNSFSQIVRIGEKVPDYIFSECLNNGSKEIALNKLKGKVILLEFWATWCSPCISEMKKLDVLQKQFQDELIIIAISDEKISRLQKYVNSTQTNLKIASDSVHRAIFPYKIIPHSILIDKDGIVRAITNPENLNKKIIENLIKSNRIDVVEKNDFVAENFTPKYDTVQSFSNSDYSIFLSGYDKMKSPGVFLKYNIDGIVNGLEVNNASLLRLYMSLFDKTMSRIVFKDSLTIADFPYEKTRLYNFSIEVSDKVDTTWKEISVDFLNSNLNYRVKETVDSLVCYEIKNVDKILKNSKFEKKEFSYGGGMYKSKSTPLNELVKYIEDFTSIPVLDSTNLNGNFDIDLNWQLEDPKTINTELKKYGLVLEKSLIKLPVTVIEIYKN